MFIKFSLYLLNNETTTVSLNQKLKIKLAVNFSY